MLRPIGRKAWAPQLCPDTSVNESEINCGMEKWKSLKRKIGRPGNEGEVEVEKLEVGHVEENPARGKHELREKKITANER